MALYGHGLYSYGPIWSWPLRIGGGGAHAVDQVERIGHAVVAPQQQRLVDRAEVLKDHRDFGVVLGSVIDPNYLVPYLFKQLFGACRRRTPMGLDRVRRHNYL